MQSGDSFRLVVRRGPQPNQIYELTKEVTTLGRDITNDIVINDREVSRHHMRITRGTQGITIEDLGSTNGTFINGKRMTGSIGVQNGDMIGLGETVTLGFEIAQVQAAPGAPASAPPAESPAPAAPDASPYQPPQPLQESSPPPAAPKPIDQYAPPADQYAESYAQPDPYQQAADPYAPQYGGSPPQAPPGYDYDPYAMRDEGGESSTKWLVLGCVVFLVLACACVSVVGLVVVDQLDIWCDVPVVSDVVQALGLHACP